MGKLYTLDGKLLTETPEIRIGDKVYPVDDRQKTVKKLMKLQTQVSGSSDPNETDRLTMEAFRLAFGDKAAKEIDDMNMPFAAYQRLFELVISAMTGEEPEEIDARFQEAKQQAGKQSTAEKQQPRLV
jgi:hypothetical protein